MTHLSVFSNHFSLSTEHCTCVEQLVSITLWYTTCEGKVISNEIYVFVFLRPVHNMTIAQRLFRFVSYRLSEAVHNLSLTTVDYCGACHQLKYCHSNEKGSGPELTRVSMRKKLLHILSLCLAHNGPFSKEEDYKKCLGAGNFL